MVAIVPIAVSLEDSCLIFPMGALKNTNPFFIKKGKQLYYAGILLSNQLPLVSNPGYPTPKVGRPRLEKRNWSELLKTQPIENSIDPALFYSPLNLRQSCKFCNKKEIVLSHVAKKPSGLMGVSACTNCGARTRTAKLPVPKLVAEVVQELRSRNYSAKQIQKALADFDVSISIMSISKILEDLVLESVQNISKNEVIEIVKKLCQ